VRLLFGDKMPGADNKKVCNSSVFCKEHSGIEVKLNKLEKSEDKQWEAINRLRNRPPLWATAVISLLTFLLGCSVTYAGLIARMVGN